MIRTIIVCDKCKITEENIRTFIAVNVHIDNKYIAKSLHLCPTCFSKLDFTIAVQKDTLSIEEQLYNLIYDIVVDAASNRND